MRLFKVAVLLTFFANHACLTSQPLQFDCAYNSWQKSNWNNVCKVGITAFGCSVVGCLFREHLFSRSNKKLSQVFFAGTGICSASLTFMSLTKLVREYQSEAPIRSFVKTREKNTLGQPTFLTCSYAVGRQLLAKFSNLART